MFAVSGHVNKPGVFEVPNGITTFRQLFDAPEYGGGVREGRARQGLHPGRRLGPVVLRGAPRPAARQADGRQGGLHARLGRHRRDGRDDRRGGGRLAGGAVLRPRVLRQVHALPRGHDLAGADPGPHPRGQRPARGPRPAPGRVGQHQPRDPVAAAPDHHLPAGPLGRVADHVRPSPASATSSSTTSSTADPSTASSATGPTASRMSHADADRAGTEPDDHAAPRAGQDDPDHRGRRPPARGAAWPAG